MGNVPGGRDARPEISIFDELLHLEPPHGLGPAWHGFSPLVSWLIARTRPALTVELGPGDRASLLSTCDAVNRIGERATFLAVRLPGPHGPSAGAFLDLVEECASAYPTEVSGYAESALDPGEVVDESQIELLHLALFNLDEAALPDLSPWLDACAPGATVVMTTASAGAAGAFTKATEIARGRYPSVRVPTGGTTEAVVAQVPVDGAAPMVDLLTHAPAAVGRYLALLGEPLEDGELLGDEPLPPGAVRAVVRAMRERQDVERAAILGAVQAYREYAAGLATELEVARRDLAAQVEAARIEREQVVREFLDRLDVLSAKISTSASRYAAQLEEKDRLIEEQQQEVLAYAGQAATAQSVIDDIRRSSSWRMTAPLRLLSRMAGRRQPRRAD